MPNGFIWSDVTSSASLIRLELALPLCRRIVVAPRSIHSLALLLALGSLTAQKRSAGAFWLVRPTTLHLSVRGAFGAQVQILLFRIEKAEQTKVCSAFSGLM